MLRANSWVLSPSAAGVDSVAEEEAEPGDGITGAFREICDNPAAARAASRGKAGLIREIS
jgi:hypothetical protein